ncbi:MAG: endonuclease/exonuclease/phosphatase family protein [Syntrophobacteraceae bacterium]
MLQIMTFNIRFQNDRDGANAWEFRRELVIDLVRNHAPSILGIQEGTTGQLRDLEKNLEGYDLFAPGRTWDENCQYCSLFFRPDAVRPLFGSEFWLSATPEVHGSKGWDSAFPRMISYGIFREAESEVKSGGQFWAGVTHLDHLGTEARARQAGIISEYLVKQGGPRILMGDFNDHPGSEAHRLLASAATGLVDTWEALRKPENESSMTYHKFTGVPQVFRMDWILASRDFAVSDARVIYDHGPGGRFPSDHFPYMVRLARV